MGVEIERKFRVVDESWRASVAREYPIAQGYLSVDAERTIRVRLKGQRGYLTVKGRPRGLVRHEFEYEIPLADARAMLASLSEKPVIEKRRYEVRVGAHLWEIDVFEGANAGLIVAEVELSRPDEEVELPPWVGREVTGEAKYYNARLVKKPYQQWDDDESGHR